MVAGGAPFFLRVGQIKMIRTWLTWVIVGAVVVVLAVGGVDALRSSEGETNPSSTTASATMSEEAVGKLPRCKREQIEVAMEILGGYAATVVQNASNSACHLRPLPIRVKLTDQAGRIMNFGLPPDEGFGATSYQASSRPHVSSTSRTAGCEAQSSSS
jgi:hypothetical protein